MAGWMFEYLDEWSYPASVEYLGFVFQACD